MDHNDTYYKECSNCFVTVMITTIGATSMMFEETLKNVMYEGAIMFILNVSFPLYEYADILTMLQLSANEIFLQT